MIGINEVLLPYCVGMYTTVDAVIERCKYSSRFTTNTVNLSIFHSMANPSNSYPYRKNYSQVREGTV